MKNIIIMALMLWAGFAKSSETISCQGNQLLFEMESYYREGNEEKPCPQYDDYPQRGTEFIRFNGKSVPMFSSGNSRAYCLASSDAAPTPAIFRGCVDKKSIVKGVNRIDVMISNVLSTTYVNVLQRVYLISGSSKIFVTSFSRQGKGTEQVFSGPTNIELSAFILSESGVESAQRLQNIQSILEKLRDLNLLTERQIAAWMEALAPYLDLDARAIDISSLGDKIPAWFKDLLKDIQQGQEKLNQDLAEESKKLEDAQNTNQKKIEEALEALDADLPELELSEELKLDDNGYNDEQLRQREQNWIQTLQQDISASDRVAFLQDVYAWEEESKVSLDTAIRLNAETPGYYPAFVSSQERILAFVRRFIDENYYFRDIPISENFKRLVEHSLKLKNLDLANRIKETLNRKYKKSVAADRAISHLEIVTSDYINGADTLTEGAQTTLINDILAFIEVAHTAVECLAKTQAAGLYASFFEIFEGRNFCDGSELDWFDRTLSFADFSADVSSKLGVKWASSINLAVTLKKMFGITSPLFRKMGTTRVKELSQVVFDAAGQLKFSSLEEFLSSLKKLFNSAKKIGIEAKDISAVTKEVDHLAPGKVVDIYESAAKNAPLGLGSTGRSTPNSLKEQAAMLVTRADPQAGEILPLVLTDSRWPATDGWQKMQTVFKTSEGRNVVIHYVRNKVTGMVDDFKFKD